MSKNTEPVDVIAIVDHQEVRTPDTHNPSNTAQLYGIIRRDQLEPAALDSTGRERDLQVTRPEDTYGLLHNLLDSLHDQHTDREEDLVEARRQLRSADADMVDKDKQIYDMKQEINNFKHQLAHAKKETPDTRDQLQVERGRHIHDMKQEIEDLKRQVANAKTDTADAIHQLELERERHNQSLLEIEAACNSNDLVAEDQLRDAADRIGALRDQIRGIIETAEKGAVRRRLKMEARHGQYRDLVTQLHKVARYNSSKLDVGMAVNRMRGILGVLQEEDRRD